MKLFYSKGACSLSTHIIINELNLDCEFETVDLATKITESGANFYDINPKGAVPSLQLDDGEIITENLVIQQYLTDRFPNESLCPPVGQIERYHILEWLSFAASDLHKSFSPFFQYKEMDENMRIAFLAVLKRRLTVLEQQLEGRDYIVGDHFTLPDAYIFVTLRWLAVAKLNIKDWSNLAAYFERIKARPSVVKSMREEGLLTH